ncbi:MAG: alanine--tRNA ligase [Alphaproteobacteria bacterium]|nr:alanine--tRNA ligase [Alphaproteobacteria bacterium]
MNNTINDIRSEFLGFFANNGHKKVSSSALIPDNDPTLMFTNAGMVQFKDVFTGKKNIDFKRATTAQKCLRAGGKHNDLDNVGYTARHHTFFEMLGNFSFGDYFKDDAINYAWTFVTKTLGLAKDRLLVTVHSSDEEAASIWKKVAGFEDSKIIRIPTSDNFWSMGDTGPCGPCTEIFYDHGEEIQGGIPGSTEEDGDRFIEIWNLVFMQLDQKQDGIKTPLPKPSIDTGMGIERIAAVLQGIHNNYDTDLFKHIIADIKHITNTCDPKYKVHNNVIADHIRAISFMIADGITPSNEGRGYVLRRIIRRAIRHGYMMGVRDPFLFKLVHSVKNVMGDHYTELKDRESTIVKVLENEEKNFIKTIDNGMNILQKELRKIGSTDYFPADIAYRLYDTYGFPLDLTQDILRESNKKVNENEFQKISKEHSEIAKKSWVGSGDSFTDKVWFDIAERHGDTVFNRDKLELDSEILEIIPCNDKKNEVMVVTKETPFYAESGGQVGDIGTINNASVIDTKKIGGIFAHKCKVENGDINVGSIAHLKVDKKHRLACSKNHTATHILQKALQVVLGDHVAQKGSLVTDKRLRFDFIHSDTISKEEIIKIEEIILNEIDKASDVITDIMNIESAKASGAMALFGEKYQDTVRVVTIGNGFSKELCGGTHISNTSQIGAFKIVNVSSIGSGLKRIEAITGRALREYLDLQIEEKQSKINCLEQTIKQLNKQLSEIKEQKATSNIELKTEITKGVTIKSCFVHGLDNKTVLNIVDKEKSHDIPLCVVIANENQDTKKIATCMYVSKKLQDKVTAKKLTSLANEEMNLGLRFGGRDDLVQFGGISKPDFERFLNSIRKHIGD